MIAVVFSAGIAVGHFAISSTWISLFFLRMSVGKVPCIVFDCIVQIVGLVQILIVARAISRRKYGEYVL